MTSQIKKKRVLRQYYTFFLACACSLIGLIFFLLGKNKIPFPDQWLLKGKAKTPTYLFFLGIGIHLQVNFVLGFFFLFINTKNTDYLKVKKWKFWISKISIFIFSLVMGLSHYWKPANLSQESWGNILLLGLIITVVNCCLLELLIQWMNQYGICNAFNLLFFTDYLPLTWFEQNNSLKQLLLLIFITILFIWLTNLKWEAPVETNTLYSQDSNLARKNTSKFGLKLSLSFMPFIYLTSFISFIYSIVWMKRMQTNWGSIKDINEKWEEAGRRKNIEGIRGEPLKKGGFWTSFLLINECKKIFNWERIKSLFKELKWLFVVAVVFFILLRWLVVWLQMRKDQWKTQEITKDLRNRGIYINYVPTGRPTRRLLKKIINKIVLFWYALILIFHFIFDNLFSSPLLSFVSWFASVNTGVELVRQIRTKFQYIKSNK